MLLCLISFIAHRVILSIRKYRIFYEKTSYLSLKSVFSKTEVSIYELFEKEPFRSNGQQQTCPDL